MYGCNVNGLHQLNAMKRKYPNGLYLSGGLGDKMENIIEKQYRKVINFLEDINQ